MLARLQKWNTLRNQILVVFLFVIAIVLLIVGALTFNQVSTLLKNNAEKQIKQTAVEANGRLNSLYEQVNSAAKLVMMNDDIQNILRMGYEGKKVTFSDRQRAMGIVNNIQSNTDGIFSFELYAMDLTKVLPLDESSLTLRVDSKWIQQAKEAKGQLVLIGEDPQNSSNILAIRRVNLLSHGFSTGGYLLISMYSNYFQFANQYSTEIKDQYSILLDRNNKQILSNFKGDVTPIVKKNESMVTINKHEFIVTKESSNEMGWTVLILTPVKALTKGINVLRMGIFLSGVIGFIIFFICILFLSTIITRPILKLTKTMQLASHGSLTMNPEVPAVNEINELNNTYNQLVKETNHLIQMVYQKEIIRSQSELKALQAQINPHFLFNTLDALRWSLEEKDEEELAELVISMANLFRYTITKQTEGDWVEIRKEIKHIEDYMEIMKMRFGNRLISHFNLAPSCQHVMIPKLLIQPLVENAVLHGAEEKTQPCTITIDVKPSRDQDYIEVTVQDDGVGISPEKLQIIKQSLEQGGGPSIKGNGMAISNVYKRLQLYYHDQLKKGLTIHSEENKGTIVSFEIPINGGEKHVF